MQLRLYAVGFALLAALFLAFPDRADSTATLATCQAPQLSLSASFYGEAGGQFIQTFTFTNALTHRCQLRGWPTVNWERVDGRLVRMRPVRVVQVALGAQPFRTVVLRARGAASFNLYGEDWNHLADRRCPSSSSVSITPPGVRAAFPVAAKLPICGRLYVSPVIAGPSDHDSWSVVWHA
jgi:hypothetical protein